MYMMAHSSGTPVRVSATNKQQPESDVVDLDALVGRLSSLDLPAGTLISRDPSNVSGSPYDYVFVLMTDAEYDGEYLIVSDNQEWGQGEEPGYLVARYDGAGEDGMELVDEHKVLTTIDAVVAYVIKEVCG